jgi:3-hydroxybutyryl-CoA dehydrogenase
MATNSRPAYRPQTIVQTVAQTVAVIGAGALGRSLAWQCAQAGLDVVLEDVLPSNLRRAQALLAEGEAPLPGRLRFASSVEDAVREADLVIDFVPDELESKLEIFSLLDRMAPPRTILCTPSNALSITDLASCTYRADRCVAVRAAGNSTVAEATAVPEATALCLLRSPMCAEATLQMVTTFWQSLGKTVQIEDDPDAPMLMHNARLRPASVVD